ncbi:putative membrane protein [Streptomyces davaonensis JCM 4913]|uniref:Putative membrane protein n=1 Tax=Streptomyces davaonensis (strain DSM 101723 / JCM 4913 / KCC S-0913 / 768) TaxID=1214101 RepID=K4QUF3_STRDJ|nr:hypothetical protein [Streptomyces davaonensis]CCK24487.1 putative membrane protein [Streptomyces davaonensis JCM 4913]
MTGNPPVLVGAVPLFHVQSMTISQGYRIERIMGSRWSQATQPTVKTIAIEAVLIGPDRLLVKKALEAMALTSRALAAAAAPLMAVAGIPVVSGLTISLDMQITDLRITQSTSKREALDVSLSLQHVPRSNLSALVGEAADMALAAGTAASRATPPPSPAPRSPGPPL